MTNYIAYLELDARGLNAATVDSVNDALESYQPSLSESPRGWLAVRISVPADSLEQAFRTAIAVVERATAATAILAEVTTEAEADAREGFATIPDLLSVTDTAEFLGVSRARVNQMIDERRLPAWKVGSTYVLPASAVQRQAEQSVVLGFAKNNPDPDQTRVILDPMYDALRTVGVLPAFQAAQGAAAGEPHDAARAAVWREAERDALQAMSMMGFDVASERILATRLR